MKKYISLILVILILTASVGSFAQINDLPVNSIYKDAVNHVVNMGIMNEVSKSVFKPNSMVSREEFAKIIITAAGLTDSAKAMNGPTIFADVSKSGLNNGYINLAINKGFLTGLADGKFHPKDSVTFAQACTAIIRALGFTDQDVPGVWPKNYIEKAKVLKLIDGINLGNNDGLTRWATALIIDRLLDTDIKKNNASAQDETFADSTGSYMKCIILGNTQTSSKLSNNQVLTDKGIFYVNSSDIKLELGGQYRFVMDGDTILSSTDNLRQEMNATVDSAVNTSITYKVKNVEKNMDLPDKTIYYYQGVKQSYDSLKGILQTNTSIVFVNNISGTGYEYAVIFDPVYSKPEVAGSGNTSTNKIGDIDFSKNPQINKNGQIISFAQIEAGDVVYQVSDIWNTNSYILVLNNTIQGVITNILPNKLSPKTIQIDSVNYDLGVDLNYSKVGNAPGAFKVGDNVTILLGKDGKVADIIYTTSTDNSNYAMVLNTSTTVSTDLTDRGTTIYNAKMLLTDGTVKTYKLNVETDNIKGKLVRYKIIDDETVSIEVFDYTPNKDYNINRDDRRIDSGFAADNIKIFDVLSNDTNKDAVAKLVNWNDLPDGKIQSGKIQFVNKNGDFDDVNIMLVNNIFDEGYSMGVVKKIDAKVMGSSKSYSYTLLINSKEYTCNTYMPDVYLGAVIRVRISDNNVVYTTYDIRTPVIETAKIQAIDTRRVKIDNTVYVFDNAISIYYVDSNGIYTQKGISDIQPGTSYGRISVYLETPYNTSKAAVIIVHI